jgi:hypothetical protein
MTEARTDWRADEELNQKHDEVWQMGQHRLNLREVEPFTAALIVYRDAVAAAVIRQIADAACDRVTGCEWYSGTPEGQERYLCPTHRLLADIEEG